MDAWSGVRLRRKPSRPGNSLYCGNTSAKRHHPILQPDGPALTPEVIDPRIADVEALARWLDYAFELPNGFRFGFAGFIGLIPGIGDIIDALASLFIIYRSIQLGIPSVAIARMLVNVGIEALAGSVPVIGDLFDVAFKANLRNYRLLNSHLLQSGRQRRSDWIFLAATVLLVVASVALPVIALVELAKHI